MIILLAMPVLIAVAAMHRYLQFYAPSNLVIRQVRARHPRWRTAAALVALAAALLLAMHRVAEAVAAGAAGWLNLVVLVLAWDAVKLAILAVATGLRATFARHPKGHRVPLRQAFPSRR